LPVKTKKIKNEKLSVAVAIIKKKNKILLVKNESGLLSGLWGLPIEEGKDEDEARNNLEARIKNDYHGGPIYLIEQGKAKHVFTHKTWQMTAYLVEKIDKESEIFLSGCVGEKQEKYKMQEVWVEKKKIEDYAVSTAIKKIIQYI
jgi:A/G-specific adenine glycosylase